MCENIEHWAIESYMGDNAKLEHLHKHPKKGKRKRTEMHPLIRGNNSCCYLHRGGGLRQIVVFLLFISPCQIFEFQQEKNLTVVTRNRLLNLKRGKRVTASTPLTQLESILLHGAHALRYSNQFELRCLAGGKVMPRKLPVRWVNSVTVAPLLLLQQSKRTE